MSASTEEAQVKTLTRDEARAAVFGAKPQSFPAKFNGIDVLIVEQSLDDIMSAQQLEDRKQGSAMMVVRFVHLPNGERLFDEADVDTILAMPFNKDMRDINVQIQKLVGVNPTAEDKSSTPAEPA